jgi:hypothetical protein
MHPAQIRTIPNLPQVTIGTLMLAGLFGAALFWSMFK